MTAGRPPCPRVPFAPLERRLRVEDLAAALGVTTRTVYRYRLDGLPVSHADTAATAAGYHPLNLWPDLEAA